MQNPVDLETSLSIACHVGLHIGLFIHSKENWFLRPSSSTVKGSGTVLIFSTNERL
jgi:hypothetical protein